MFCRNSFTALLVCIHKNCREREVAWGRLEGRRGREGIEREGQKQREGEGRGGKSSIHGFTRKHSQHPGLCYNTVDKTVSCDAGIPKRALVQIHAAPLLIHFPPKAAGDWPRVSTHANHVRDTDQASRFVFVHHWPLQPP